MRILLQFHYVIADCAIGFMRQRKSLLSLLLFFIFAQTAFSQSNPVTVNGFVRDSTGTGVANVTVTEKGTRNATSTGVDGAFTLSVAGTNSVLVFTSVGFLRKEVKVGTQTTIAMLMEAENKDLGEVVVIGYGSRKKECLT